MLQIVLWSFRIKKKSLYFELESKQELSSGP